MRSRWLAAWLCLLVVVAACAVPHRKDLDVVTKKAVTLSEASNVISRFNRAIAAADTAANPRGLAEIEGGSLLDIDMSAFFVRQRLGVRTSTTRLDAASTIVSGAFERYPLWFVAVGDVYAQREKVAGVFVRDSSTAAWRLELAPRLATSTPFPSIRRADDGSAVLLSPTARRKLPVSPQDLVYRYAQTLADPRAEYADDFVQDAFLASVRELQEAQREEEEVAFTQTWSAAPVSYALRMEGGGALVFATLERTDNYRVLAKHSLRWQGSEVAAYFPRPVRSAATLTYAHQLLIMLPTRGKPLLIGQYGGLVNATGH